MVLKLKEEVFLSEYCFQFLIFFLSLFPSFIFCGFIFIKNIFRINNTAEFLFSFSYCFFHIISPYLIFSKPVMIINISVILIIPCIYKGKITIFGSFFSLFLWCRCRFLTFGIGFSPVIFLYKGFLLFICLKEVFSA